MYIISVAGELCKLARVRGPEFPHPFSPVGRCLPATGRCRAVRYKRQCMPGFCTLQGSRRDQKIKRSSRREVELDPQLCPEEIMSREVELG